MKYFLIAGEASGDLHASHLMHELKKQDQQAEFCFLGGDLMLAEGGEMIKHYRQMAFMGFVAVLKNLSIVLSNIKECKQALVKFQPDVLILIDYPSFNLRMAEFAKKKLNIPVYYYISPKIWAWKEYRIKKIKRYVDKMFTIFPFETEFYAKHSYPVEYVGNPTVDAVEEFKKSYRGNFQMFSQFNNLLEKPVIALLAGSRRQEIKSCLPRMIEASMQFSDYQPVIAGAPGIEKEFYFSILKNSSVAVVFGQTYELLLHSEAAIVNSGTATLETALIGTPQVVVYHVAFGKLAYWLKKLFIKVKYISLVNLMAGKEVVKELYAHLFTVENLKKELNAILTDERYREKMKNDYKKVAEILGEAGAANRAAKKIFVLLQSGKSLIIP
ncbi:MAG TPA: lipid-A-disaccharide synthase [Paludibacteraceae bacterium]|nr:lipid-A-disaccharide synthase [Paludibacteraceae bacterium]